RGAWGSGQVLELGERSLDLARRAAGLGIPEPAERLEPPAPGVRRLVRAAELAEQPPELEPARPRARVEREERCTGRLRCRELPPPLQPQRERVHREAVARLLGEKGTIRGDPVHHATQRRGVTRALASRSST